MELDPQSKRARRAVALGHPLAAAGPYPGDPVNILKQNKARYGAAGICNGEAGLKAGIENLYKPCKIRSWI
jgi:acetyl-CoA C-acetyltransferase